MSKREIAVIHTLSFNLHALEIAFVSNEEKLGPEHMSFSVF